MPKKPRILVETVELPAEFRAYQDHVVAIIWVGNSSIGIRFNSPEHILTFMTELMEKAKLVWANNPLIQEYLSDD